MSHDLLDELLADAPHQVVPDIAGAWEAGARRRRRTQVLGLVGVTAVAALGVVAVTQIELQHRPPVAPAGEVATVGGHPAVVEKPFVEGRLPSRPGPMAGSLQTQDGSWHLVDENGRAWSLATEADAYPALSDDGTRLGALRIEGPDHGVYETLDLNSGATTRYEDVGSGLSIDDVYTTDQPYRAASQQPAYWSPDGRRLLVPGGRTDSTQSNALLLEDGRVTALDVPGFAVGWASDSDLVWLSGSTASITDLSGAVVREVVLQPTGPLAVPNQWSGRVSPDGTKLSVLDVTGEGESRLWTFSLLDGTPVGKPRRVSDQRDPTCASMWRGEHPVLWQFGELREYPGSTSVLDFADDWGVIQCSVWAAEALAGPVQDQPGAWEWRYWDVARILTSILGGLVVVLFVGGIFWLDRRSRRRDEPDDAVDWWGGDPA